MTILTLKVGLTTFLMGRKFPKMLTLFFEDTGRVFTLNGDLWKLRSDYNFDEAKSSDANFIISHLNEKNFDPHTSGQKSSTNKYRIKHYHSKRHLLASGAGIFLQKNPYYSVSRRQSLIKQNQEQIDNNKLDEVIVSTSDKLLEYKIMTSTQHKSTLTNSKRLSKNAQVRWKLWSR